jgi:hypothetical protein
MQLPKLLPVLLPGLFALIANKTFAQPGPVKKINLTVVNEITGKPVSEAQVTLTNVVVVSQPIVQTTDNFGKASFEVIPAGSVINVEVKGSFLSGLRNTTATIRVDEKESYALTISLRSSDKIINVFVSEDETNKPIPGAEVVLVAAKDTKDSRGITDASGKTIVEADLIDNTRMMALNISKNGYKPYKGKVQINSESNNYTVNAVMVKEEGVKTLKVTVVDEKNLPVVDASVTADLSLLELSRGSTNQSGMVDLALKSSGNYKVSVIHSNFEPEDKEITIQKYGSQDVYTLEFQLKRKKSTLRDVKVYVYEVSTNKPIPNAFVDATASAGTTNSNGIVYLPNIVKLGESGSLTVSATNFETRTKTYIGGGEGYRYSPPIADEVWIGLNRTAIENTLTIQVLSDATNRPIGNAAVSVKTLSSGKLIFSGLTGASGEKTFKIKTQTNDNNTFRVMAHATGYEDRWSDITPDFMQSAFEQKYYTIFLKKKQGPSEAEEKKYGPFSVGMSEWVSTGLSIKKGSSFRVELTGKITYVEAGTNETREINPDGHGHWSWWALQARIGTQTIIVGTKGGGYASQDGVIELGAPRTSTIYPEDAKDKSGTWSVYIYARDAIQSATAEAPAEKIKQAKEKLGFLKTVFEGDKIPNKDPEQIAQEVKAVRL